MWKIPLIIISLLLIVAIAYVVYVFVDYNRIEDNVAVEPQGTAELIPEGFSCVTDYKSGLRPSTRNTYIPYSPESFVVTLDGFIVSDNVQPDYVDVVDTGFLYSDHNPVELRFILK